MNTVDRAIFQATRGIETPLLVLNTSQLKHNVSALRAALPGVELWYALKCNSHRAVVETLTGLGVGFEVASSEEVKELTALGVEGKRMMCFHPVKSPDFVRLLTKIGVSTMAVDSRDEVEKLQRLAPRCELIVRIATRPSGSRVPLLGKFGCASEEAVDLARAARRRGMTVAGLTMHVGSQCESTIGWAAAIETAKHTAARLGEEGFALRLFSLGGGLPVSYTDDVPTLEQFGHAILGARPHASVAPQGRVTIEPGRAIAASAGTLVSTVVGTATRSDAQWLYLDAGIYHGLFEMHPAAGGLALPLISERSDGPRIRYRVGGPTCDSMDVLPGTYELPEQRVGDRVAFLCAGAYSTALSTRFNGFPPPRTRLSHTAFPEVLSA